MRAIELPNVIILKELIHNQYHMTEPMMGMGVDSPKTPEERNKEIIEQDKQDLETAGKAHDLDLGSRMIFGLDPAGMLAVRDTLPEAKKVAETLGTDVETIWPLIAELHTSGPWKFADRLKDSPDAQIKAYIVLAQACEEKGWPGYKDDPAGYVQDRERIIKLLNSFKTEDFDARKQELQARIEGFEDLTHAVDGKTIKIAAASKDAALPLSTRGFEGCIVRAKDDRYAQTANIPDALLEAEGLAPGYCEDYDPQTNGFVRVPIAPGKRIVWVDKAEIGKPLAEMTARAKRIFPGYVLTYKDEEMAKRLVSKAVAE